MADEPITTTLGMLGLPAWQASLRQAGGDLFGFGRQLSQTDQLLARGAVGLVATAGLLGLLGHAARAAGEEQAALSRSMAGFQAHGNMFPTAELRDFSLQMEQRFGVMHSQVAGVVGLMGDFGVSLADAERLTPGIYNLAAAFRVAGRSISPEMLGRRLGAFLETGQARGLGMMLGISTQEAKAATTPAERLTLVLSALARTGGDAADRFRHTWPGALMAASAAWTTFEQAVGRPLLTPLTGLVGLFTGFAGVLIRIPGLATTVTLALAGGAVAMGVYAYSTLSAARALIFFNLQQARLAAGLPAQAPGLMARLGLSGGALPMLALGGVALGGSAVAGALPQGGGFLGALGRIGGATLAGAGVGAVFGNLIGAIPGAVAAGIGATLTEVLTALTPTGDEAADTARAQLAEQQKTNSLLEDIQKAGLQEIHRTLGSERTTRLLGMRLSGEPAGG